MKFGRVWRNQARISLVTVAILAAGCSVAAAEDYTLHTFRKVKLTDKFYSEGAHWGDFDHDGNGDVAAGPFWYKGPDYKQAHEFRPPQAFDPHKYSNAFLMFTGDFNQDDWDDILVVGWPGKDASWFENPKAAAGHWKRHVAFDIVDNESPGLADVTGDGKPELLFHTRGRLGYAEPNWKSPGQLWRFQPISGQHGWGRYQHGFGYGDINGDGRADFLMHGGWWQQPAPSGGDAAWKHHAFNFGAGRGGAQMLVYDVDGDKDNDVITTIDAHGYGLSWFEQLQPAGGGVTFKEHQIVGRKPEDNPYGVKITQMHALFPVDMDGDGLKDFVTGKRYWAHGPKGDAEPGAPAVLYWFRLTRTGDGKDVHFVPYLIDNDSGIGTQVVAGDVSGNGLPDVVVGNKKGAFLHLHEVKKVTRAAWLAAQPERVD
ncbi:MAG: VCBS repeat-containing protein [Planctomycetota bacterium]|nr:VCBS repeat-containing protein [Planctomycetota bacterium]